MKKFELPEHLRAGIALTARHEAADRAIAYALGALESATPLLEDGTAKTAMKTALAPLRAYENASSEPPKEQ